MESSGLYFKELIQFNIREENLEKEQNGYYTNVGLKFDLKKEFTEIKNFVNDLQEKRKADQYKMKQHLFKIRHISKIFSKEVSDLKLQDKKIIDHVRSLMEEVEQSIHSFKEQEQSKYEVLLVDERSLQIDISALDKKVDAWGRGEAAEFENARRQSKFGTGRQDVTLDLPIEVASFERFLAQSGGHNGNWDDLDHNVFLRIRDKHKGRLSFLDELIANLPTRTPEQCRQHEVWFQEYNSLKERKKAAIQRWRAQKAESEEAKRETAVQEMRVENADDVKENSNSNASLLTEREQAAKKMQVDAWRLQKRLVQQRQKMEEEAKFALERQAAEERERKKRDVQRERVAQFKEKRAMMCQMRALEMEVRRAAEKAQARPADEELRRIASRNARFVEEKRARAALEEQRAREREERLDRLKARVEPTARRDPDRLLQPTAGWCEHVRATAEQCLESTSAAAAGQLPPARIPHRAIPSWRQGVL